MAHISTHLKSSINWNTIESLLYNGLMMLHQWLLFKHTSFETIGMVGSLFSIIYLSVTCLDFGCEATLSAHFALWSFSQKSFRSFFIKNYFPTFVATTIAAAIVILSPYHVPLFNSLDQLTKLCIIITIFSEGMRKISKTILQIAFRNKMHTILELGMMVSYALCVWSAVWLGAPLGIPLLFITLCLASVGCTIATMTQVINWHFELPTTHEAPEINQWNMIKNRFFSYTYKLGITLFSSNFIVPLIALRYDFAYAGMLRLIMHMIHNITSIIHKVFGSASGALFAHIKSQDQTTQQTFFSEISLRLNQTLYAVIIFCVINYKTVIGLHATTINTISLALCALCFILQMTESFGITLERLFITFEKSNYLFLTTLYALIPLIISTMHAPARTPLIFLSLLAATRIISLATLYLIAHYQLKIRFFWRTNPTYIVGSCIISLLFFILSHQSIFSVN